MVENLNVKSLQIDKLHNDPLQAEIRSLFDIRLNFFIEFDKTALNIAGSQGNSKNNYSQTLLVLYIIFAMELLGCVDTF